MRYNYYATDNKIICVSHYAGKAVRGVAKCDPKDDFDIDAGKKLAKARCDQKISDKRARRARERYDEALKIVKEALAYKARMENYLTESLYMQNTCTKNLEELVSKM